MIPPTNNHILPERHPTERQRRAFHNRAQRLRLWQRLDSTLLAFIMVVIVLLVGGWWAVTEIGRRAGWFDAPVMQPLPDNRILTNVYDDIGTRPFLDAAVNAADRQLWVSQQGGILHIYDPLTELWRSETPFDAFPANPPVDDKLVLLRVGCGDDMGAQRPTPCPDPRSVWALGADGSLIYDLRDGAGWRIGAGNGAFIGADGTPVTNDDLTAAAVSADRQWLLLGTRNQGMGVYNVSQGRWLAATAPDVTDIQHVVWWRDRFYIGTPDGLYTLRLQNDTPDVQPVTTFDGGSIRDLDAADDLWVLAQRTCDDGGNGCLWLGRYTAPDTTPIVMLNQRHIYADVNLATLHHATLSGQTIIMAGEAGIYAYDTGLHSWSQLSDARVGAILPLTDGDGFYFAYAQGIGLVENAALVDTWDVLPEPVDDLTYGAGNNLFAISQLSRDVWRFSPATGEAERIYEWQTFETNPATFTGTLGGDDSVLFVHDEGAVLHDTRYRTYEDIEARDFPNWFLTAQQYIHSDDAAFVIASDGGQSNIYAIAAADIADGSYFRRRALFDLQPLALSGVPRAIWTWGTDSLAVVAPNGAVTRLAPDSRDQVIGPEAALPSAFADVTRAGGVMVFAEGQTLYRYDLATRSWQSTDVTLDSNEVIAELAYDGNNLILRSNQGRLVDGNGTPILGGGSIAILDTQLRDVWQWSDALYIAGVGRSVRYDWARRSVTHDWQLPPGNPRIQGIHADIPLVQVGTQAVYGRVALSPDAGAVQNATIAFGWAWTVRETNNTRYLMGHDLSNPNLSQTRCYYRHPVATNATQISDARQINNAVAVATDAGLKFYNLNTRSWYDAPLSAIDRVYSVGDEWLFVREQANGVQLTLINAADVQWSPSCDDNAAVTWQNAVSIAARDYAVDETSGRVAWLLDNGAIVERQNGGDSTLLPPVTQPPPDIRGVYPGATQDDLLFTTADGLWRYDLTARVWQPIALMTASGTINATQIDISADNRLTVRDDNGQWYSGILDNNANEVLLTHVYTSLNGSASGDVLDVQILGDVWVFVYADRLRYLNPVTRQWVESPVFGASSTAAYGLVGERGVYRNDNGWWIAQSMSDTPQAFALYAPDSNDTMLAIDGDGVVWRYTASGDLLRCEASGGAYACVVHALPNAADGVTGLAIDGGLVANRAGGSRDRLANAATMITDDNFSTPPALDVGWLRWQRDQNAFVVRTGNGEQTITPQQLINGDQWAFETVQALSPGSGTTWQAANTAGIWAFTQSDLRLNDTGIVFYPIDLTTPISAIHGRFIDASGQQAQIANGQLVTGPAQNVRFDNGTVTFTQAADGGVSVSNTYGNSDIITVLTPSGFLWDSNRRNIAYESGTGLLLQSDAGIHGATSPVLDFDPPTSGDLRGDGRGGAYVLENGTWYRRGNIQPVADPTQTRTLIQTPVWSWALNNGALSITLTTAPHNFGLLPDAVGFSSDQLAAASALDDTLFIATDAYLQQVNNLADMGGYAATRSAPIQTDSLTTYYLPDGTQQLISTTGATIETWNSATQQFTTATVDYRQQRPLVDTSRLRMTYDNGAVTKEIRLDDINGGDAWVTFNFVNGRFPFDQVTAITTFDDLLYIGSAAGLQETPNANALALDQLNALYDMSGTGNLQTVIAAGQPDAAPDIFMARSSTTCYERQRGQPFAPCVDASLLDSTVRYSDTLWHWTRINNALVGRYRTAGGTLDNQRIEIGGGQWPHDRVQMGAVCNGQAYSIGGGRWLTLTGNTYSLNNARQILLDNVNPARLLCFETTITHQGETMRNGLYLQAVDGQVLRFDGGGFTALSSASQATALLNYVDNPPVWSANRLRYRSNTGFEYRNDEGGWQLLDWRFDVVLEGWSLGIDTFNALLRLDSGLWAATPAGFVPLNADTDSNLYIDPDTWVLVRQPDTGQGICRVTDVLTDGNQATVRCDGSSQRVYQGVLDGNTDTPAFTTLSDDPFAAQTLIEADDTLAWQWRVIDRIGASRGRLQTTLRGDDVQIIGGRFDFDTVNSIALFDDGLIELATDEAGWYQAPRNTLTVAGWSRPLAASVVPDVDEVRINGTGENRLLCLRTPDDDFVRLTIDKQPQDTADTCPAYQGDDGFWQYARDDDGLRITAAARGGLAERALRDGRFTDAIITGLPTPYWLNPAADEATPPTLRYLVPTAAGVVVWDAALQVRDIYGGDFAGLEADTMPQALFIWSGDDGAQTTPAYWGDNTLYDLQTRSPIADAPQTTPGGLVLALAYGPEATLRLRWQDGDQRGWTIVPYTGAGGTPLQQAYAVDVRDNITYIENRRLWGDPPPGVTIQRNGNQLDFRFAGQLVPLALPPAVTVRDIIRIGERVYVVGAQTLLEVDISAGMVNAVE